jgi:hypothetical protein
MSIRTYQPGDEVAQVGIYNEATADLPKFKPATLEDVRRRIHDPGFDPITCFYIIEDGSPVGYANYHANGRLSYPWCLKGHERHADELFRTVLASMKDRGLRIAFAAYRADWTPQRDFLLNWGFQKARDMINYVIDLAEMPTPAARPMRSVTPLQSGDVAKVFELQPGAARAASPAEFEQYLIHNRYYPASSCFVSRGRTDGQPTALGVLIENAAYADPYKVDSNMPCFRLGAVGTEGMHAKRINGLFSFLARADRDANMLGLELLGYAASRLDASDLATMAAQVPSDQPHLARFYQQYFRRQGSFPVYERALC